MPNAESIARGLHAWINQLADEGRVNDLLAHHRLRLTQDDNIRRSAPPDGWVSLRQIASDLQRNAAHLSRNAQGWAAAGLAGLYRDPRGHHAWHISPELAADLRATSRNSCATQATFQPDIAKNVRTSIPADTDAENAV